MPWPRGLRRAVASMPVFVAPAVVVVACQSPTAVSVEIDTDLSCELVHQAGVTLTVGSSTDDVERERPNTVAHSCDERTGLLNFVGDLTLRRGDNDDVVLRVVLTGDTGKISENDCAAPAYDGCVVARRKLRYVPNQSLRVPVTLRRSCIGTPCGPDQTCVRGLCVSAVMSDPSACSGDGCDESLLLPPGATPPEPGPDGGSTDGGARTDDDGEIGETSDGSNDAADRSVEPIYDPPVYDGGIDLPDDAGQTSDGPHPLSDI